MLAAIAVGGALGALCRHLVAAHISRWLGLGFPYGTLGVNIVGSLLMGVIIGLLVSRLDAGPMVRALITTGFLGGFTTFSAFSLETVLLVERGSPGLAMLYAFMSVLLCVGAVFLGLWLGRA